jgi:hypothetical protein
MAGKRADQIAKTRTVDAKTVLDGKFDAGAYPHRHLAVEATVMLGTPHVVVSTVLAAVETLGRAGRELVTFGPVSDKALCAVVRKPPVLTP